MAGNAIETAKQENGSRVYFEAVIEKNLNPDSDSAKLLNIVRAVYPEVGSEWMSSYSKQVKALKGYIRQSKGYEYSRDSGFMPFIEGIAKNKCGVTVKDRWNPADIYMVKKTKKKEIEDEIVSLTSNPNKDSNLIALNEYMKSLIKNLDMLPISLKAIKKTTPTASVEEANMGGASKNLKFTVVPGSVKCILDFGHKTDGEFDTGEFAWDFNVNGMQVHGQSRNFQYSQPRNLVQTDLTPKGAAAGAKLGKVSSQALDSFLSKHNMMRPSSPSKDPNIDPPGQWKQTNIDYWIEYINNLQNYSVGGRKIDLGSLKVKSKNTELVGAKAVIETAVMMEGSTRSAAGRFSSKLIGLRWAYTWASIEEAGLMEDWLKTLYYGAKKEGVKNGPFLKIS